MEVKEIVQRFKEILDNPFEYLKGLKRPIIAYTCTYVPDEIIWGLGFHPARIIGTSENLEIAQMHLQPYCCPVGKSILQDLLSKNLPTAHVVFANTCDTMQRISDIFRINKTNVHHIDFMVPTKLNSKPSEEYLYNITKKFYHVLKKDSHSEDKVLESIHLFNHMRDLIKRITYISSQSTTLSNLDLYIIQLVGMVMDREEYTRGLEGILNSIESSPQQKFMDQKRIIISGSMCQSPLLYKILDQLSARVVYNDTCTGNRAYDRDVHITKDIIKGVSTSFIDRPICAAKHAGTFSKIDYLKYLIKKYRAQGMIYLVPKFCDPHSFDFPDIRAHINIPILFLEIEHQHGLHGQEHTRIQAFLERL